MAGVLACLDGYMNIAMEQTEEYVDGQLKAKYGDTFIRGNNGTHARVPIHPSLCTSISDHPSLFTAIFAPCLCVAVLYISTQKRRA